MPSDAELIAQILAGQTDSYAALVQRYERLARSAALRLLRDSHVADDVAQEAFVAAYQGLSSLRDRTSFSAWLLGIVRRRASTAIANRRRALPTIGDIDQHACLPRREQPMTETGELLEAVDRLPDQERVVIGLMHFEGHSAKEIAEITGRPVGTVTKQLSRARQRLSLWLTKEKVQHEQIH